MPDWRQFLDAGVQFTTVTREQAERIAEDLVREGKLASDNAQAFVDDLIERRRRWTEELQSRISDEIQRQVKRQLRLVGVATQDDIRRLEAEIGVGESKKKPAKKKPAKKKPAKKKPAKKKPAKKKPAKKKPATRSSGR
ncbi:MAG: hypothetical protein R3A49_03110 [Acidimicrobiia bacterium]